MPMLALLMPSLVLFHGRYPAARVVSEHSQPAISRMQALRTPNVLFYLVVSLLFSSVTDAPMMFVTTFGADLNLDASDRALALFLVFASNMLGTYLLGRPSDRIFHQGLMGASSLSASLIRT